MADDLGDEWWTQADNKEGQSEGEEEAPKSQKEQSTNSKPKKRKSEKKVQENAKKKKKTVKTEGVGTQETSEEKTDEKPKSKKRRKKKKTITDVLSSSNPVAGAPADFINLLKSHHSESRSVIEQEELKLDDACFLGCNDLTHSLSSYLKEVCPKWAKLQKQHIQTRSLVLLIVCGSALRSIHLMKQLIAFKGPAKVLKLFARHIKLDEQMKVLGKAVAHIGVGTPGRISALLEKEALSVQGMRFLVVDWNYRDQKQRRMVDIPEVKKELVKMMDHGLIQSCRGGSVKIGLF